MSLRGRAGLPDQFTGPEPVALEALKIAERE